MSLAVDVIGCLPLTPSGHCLWCRQREGGGPHSVWRASPNVTVMFGNFTLHCARSRCCCIRHIQVTEHWCFKRLPSVRVTASSGDSSTWHSIRMWLETRRSPSPLN